MRTWAVFKRGVGRRVVALLFLLGIAPLSILTGVFVLFFINAQLEKVEEVQTSLAQGISASISAHLERTEGQVRLFAQMLDLSPGSRQDLTTLANGFLDQGHEYGTVTVADREGNELCKVSRYYTFRPFELDTIGPEASFQGAIRGETFIGPIEFCKFSKAPEVAIAVPIHDLSDHISGVLEVKIHVAAIWHLVSKHSVGQHRVAYVVDRRGDLLAHREASWVLQKRNLGYLEGVKAFLTGNAGASQYRGINGAAVIGAAATVPLTGWGVIVEEPVRAVFKTLFLLSVVILGLSVITAACATVLGIRFSYKEIVAPIRLLQGQAEAISRGELGKTISMERSDEIGQLAESFNTMAEELKKTTVSRDLLTKEINEREETEQALRASDLRFRELFDNLTSGVAVYEARDDGKDFFFKDVNRAVEGIENVRKADLLGRSVREVFPGVVEFGLFEVLRRVWSTGVPERLPLSFYKDGRICGWRDSYVYRLPSGEVVVVYTDETERKQAEEERENLKFQLQQAERMESIGTLAGGIAHDFNNILGAVIGYAQLAEMEIPKDNRANGSIAEVLKAADRARDLVKQILTFSRQSEGERRPLQPALVVKEALKFLRASIPSTIEIRGEVADDTAMVNGDPTQLHQVVMNLCTNAVHAMGQSEGVLAVELAQVNLNRRDAVQHPDLTPGSYVRLSVSDTGPGMDASVQERVFEPFFTTKAPGEGTGMGLSVVHGIVKNHGGAITVYSEVEKGTTFNVFLPVIEGEAVGERETSALPLPTGTERILLVDDEPSLVHMMRQMLERLGYHVVSRTSSLEALEAFRTQPNHFDLVVTDQTMPNMTGLELARKMMGIRPDIPVVLCTGYSYVVSEEDAKQEGVRAFLMKPVVMEQLAQTIRAELEIPADSSQFAATQVH